MAGVLGSLLRTVVHHVSRFLNYHIHQNAFGWDYLATTAHFRITTLFTSIKLAGILIGMPIILWFAQVFDPVVLMVKGIASFESWRHGTGLFAGRGDNLRAFPILLSAGNYPHPPS